MQKINVLSLPGFKSRIDPNSFDKQSLLKDIKEDSKLQNNIKDWDAENYSTIKIGDIDFTCLEEEYHKIIKDMISTFEVKNKNIKYNFNISNYTLAHNQHSIRLHEHTAHGDFTMLHYLSFDKKLHSPTMFLNTHNFGQYMESIRPDMYNVFKNNYNNSWLHREFYIDIEEDEVLIMPSTIPHYVAPKTETNKDRIIVATNIQLG